MHNAVLDIVFVEGSGSQIVEPITLLQAKKWLKIDVNDEDTLIQSFITVARQQCENYLNISLIQRKVIAFVNNSLGGVWLPFAPVAEILDVQDKNGKEIEYTIHNSQFKQLMFPKLDYVRVEYNAGFTTLPQHFKTAMLIALAYIYEHRGDEHAGQFSPMAKGMLKPYRRV
jgi:uncharacterized phiE125 gp8 family phage protein